MSISNYLKFLSISFVFLFFSQALKAQNELPSFAASANPVLTYPSSTTYLGVRGGYFFPNKKLSTDPQWHLKDGFHVELTTGYKKGVFGWSGALGYLNLSRNVDQIEQFNLNTQDVYNSLTGNNALQPMDVVSGLNQNSFSISSPQNIQHQPFRGFYLLTGPNLWLGEGRLKGVLSVEGGIGLNQMGYYHQMGHAAQANGMVELQVEGGAGTGPDYEMTLEEVSFERFSLSSKYLDQIGGSNATPPFNEKEPYELMFIGRAGAQLEYFIQPNLSLHAGASYWYIATPEMTSTERVTGYANYLEVKSGRNIGHEFDYHNSFEQKNLSLFSGNIGLKYWLGNKNRVRSSGGGSKEDQLKKRVGDQTIVVNVVDQLTKTPIADANVRLMNTKTREVFELKTQSNGVATFSNIIISDYELTGNLYGVNTTSDFISIQELDDQNGTLYKTLYYNDHRFILKGVTLNTDHNQIESGVTVSLESGAAKVSQVISEENGQFTFLLEPQTDYQIQGLKDGLYSSIENISTKSLNRSQQLYVQLHLGVSPAIIGKYFIVDNILYDFDAYNIRPDAAIELDRLVAFLNTNPKLKIELSAHTDSRGNNNYNLNLSQKRAQSAVAYLISQGISSNRLVAKGYGENQLLNHCQDGIDCSEQEHQVNRRTEIKIIE